VQRRAAQRLRQVQGFARPLPVSWQALRVQVRVSQPLAQVVRLCLSRLPAKLRLKPERSE
jgi:hypothetical protein